MIERGSLLVLIVDDIERSPFKMRTFLLYAGVVLFAGAMWLGFLEILKVVVAWIG